MWTLFKLPFEEEKTQTFSSSCWQILLNTFELIGKRVRLVFSDSTRDHKGQSFFHALGGAEFLEDKVIQLFFICNFDKAEDVMDSIHG